MTNAKGTNETLHALDLAFTVAELVAKEIAGDGLQWTDAVKIVMSPEFQAKLAEALAGFTEIPGEIEDLSGYEGIEIAEYALGGAKRLLKSLGRAA